MLFFLVSCLSFLLLSQSFLKQHPTSKIECRKWVLNDALHRFFLLLSKKRKNLIRVFQVPSMKRILSARFDFETFEEVIKEETSGNFLLDLPDLPLDCVLEKLSHLDLYNLSRVCSTLRQKCTSDHLWEKHMNKKWGGVIGDAAYREWQCQIASKRAHKLLHCKSQSKFKLFSGFFDFFGFKSEQKSYLRSSLPVSSVMSCYLALENGKFWFPAQVFNRENGHVGFVLSCYDARLSYGSTSDNFIARYRAQGRSVIEEGIDWDRIRAPTIDTPANVLHVTDCLDDLKPGDHIEIQWRRNKEFPYESNKLWPHDQNLPVRIFIKGSETETSQL
ncbi:F-box protein at2g32560 [Phtheirospermum japonicum]|uniref:F-box protein at2g32560 n=1 Tax=Phtheirospermum japonicum TaxID=374723 RepID=A0A830C498_9LAMI|nr:F-box protein at2g32560 [Phtheirospermum japonicum]